MHLLLQIIAVYVVGNATPELQESVLSEEVTPTEWRGLFFLEASVGFILIRTCRDLTIKLIPFVLGT